jgi:hypothetical protein
MNQTRAMKNYIIKSCLISFFLIILSGCTCPFEPGGPLGWPIKLDPVPPITERQEDTLNGYTQIREGMTYPEVVAIIGEEGEKTTSVSLDDKKLTPCASEKTYSWKNPDGSKFVATFIDGKLVTKTLVGLD